MGWRKIDINGKIWDWRVAGNDVFIKGPKGERGKTDFYELYNATPNEIERAKWKGNFRGTGPGIIRKYIEDNLIDKSESLPPLSETIPILKAVFNSEKYGEYAGGTLTVKINEVELNCATGTTADRLLFFNVGKGRNEDENSWIALNYIRYKKKGSFFPEAYKIVEGNPRFKKHLTIALLKE